MLTVMCDTGYFPSIPFVLILLCSHFIFGSANPLVIVDPVPSFRMLAEYAFILTLAVSILLQI
jgi:hypothetical protein